MGGTTASGVPYVTPTDKPKEFPAHSQALANVLEAARTKAANAVRPSDVSGLATGASAGFTATLTGLRVGQQVVGIIHSVYTPSAASSTFVTPTPTGLTLSSPSPVAQKGNPTAGNVEQQLAVLLMTATASTVTLGYTVTVSAGTWTVKTQSSITLIAL